MLKIRLAQTDEEIKRCFPLMVQLRTTFAEEEFFVQVKRQQQEGYKIVYGEKDHAVMALAGFREIESLSWGKAIYIDDLITDVNNRSKG